MPLNTRLVGESTDPFVHSVDARWLMAYAAGIGDMNPRYLDTGAQAVVAHPMFPVCLEWPAVLAAGRLPGHESSTAKERARGVHAAHDVCIYRPIHAGMRLATRATVAGIEAKAPGAVHTTRLDTVDEASGELITRSFNIGIYRDVAIEGEPRVNDAPPPPIGAATTGGGAIWQLDVPGNAAHVYTECARIWNPIHTDRAFALAAGLPDIILHGTATMAMAVSRLVDECLGGDPTRVRRLGGRFAAMVLMPSTLTLEVTGVTDGAVFYELRTGDGQPAIRGGYIGFE